MKLRDDVEVIGGLRAMRQVDRLAYDVVQLRRKWDWAEAHVDGEDVLVAE
jgi:hypothetical protein